MKIRLEEDKEEKLSDVFKPLPPEEIERRKPIFKVSFFSVDWSSGEPTYEQGVMIQKEVEVKSQNKMTAPLEAIRGLGIDTDRLRMTHYGPGNIFGRWIIKLKPEDKVFGIYSRPLVGWYGMLVRDIE